MVEEKRKKPKKQKTELLEKKAKEFEDQFKRVLADYSNLKRRTEEERKSFVKFANCELLVKILPVLDNLEKAAKSLNDEGVNIIIKQFQNTLEEEGVEEMRAEGKVFNPEEHEAVLSVGNPEKWESGGKVVEVIEKGYLYHGRVLRVAKVKVG